MNSKRADRGVEGAPQLTDLDNGATASDSDSSLQHPLLLSPPVLPFFIVFFSLYHLFCSCTPFFPSCLSSLCSLGANLPCQWLRRAKYTTATSLLLLTPHPLPHVCSLSRQAGLKSQLRIEPSRLKLVSIPALPTPSSPL